MKKFVAMMLAMMTMVGAGVAQKSKSEAAVSKAVAAPAINASGANIGYIPVFTDTGGDVTDSALNQVINSATTPPTTYLGFNTATPQFNLHFTTTVDPAAVTIDGYGSVGINYIGRRADGTLAAPTAVQTGDNLMTMQGRGWFLGVTPGVLSGFSALSRANMKFFAAEPWTDTKQGAYLTFGTTLKGTASSTASAAERMRITDAGNVGIGTTTPGTPLEVNGSITLTNGSGGVLTFPNLTQQATAAYNLTPANNTLTVGGTATAPTIAVNTAVVQPILTGASCPAGDAITSITAATGAVVCGSVGPGGTLASTPVIEPPQAPFTGTITGTFSTVGSNTATVFTTATAGLYRVSVYMNDTPSGSCPSLPATPCAGVVIEVGWNDGISSVFLDTAHCDLTVNCGNSGSVPMIFLPASTPITVVSALYGPGTGVPSGSGSYTAYVVVERL